MSDSIWKKEISFGRKPKAPEAPAVPAVAAEPKQSLLKKEISFGRKPKAPKAPKEPKAVAAEPKQSLLKKEISFGRKPKAPPAPKEPKQSPMPKAPKQSLWKKELSLGRKQRKDDEAVAKLAELATHAVVPEYAPEFAAAPPEPVAPPTQVAEAVLAAEPEPAAYEPVAYEPVAYEPGPVPEPVPVPVPVPAPVAPPPVAETFAPPVADVHPVETLPLDEPPAPAAPVAAVVPLAPPPSQHAAAEQPVVDPVPVVPAPVQPAEPDYHVAAGPVEGWMEPPAAEEPWLAEPELPPAPDPVQVVVHPPVTAAELPPLPVAKVPFWKKELSFGKKPKPVAAPAAPVAAPAAKVPFWKKELSFGKQPKQPAADATTAPLAAPAEKVPFWKKELGGGKKAGQAPKAPRVKRGFSLPTLSLPSLSLGGGKGGHHHVKRLVGLKVGGSQLAAARVANNGAAELLQVARVDLDPGIVVSGELRDPDSLAEALKAFFAANRLPRKNVRLGIASNRIGVRTFDISGIDDAKQLENAIQFRAQETLPIPLDEAVLDYQVLEEREDEEGTKTKRVLLVVAYRELVDRYVSACRKAGITLAGIDLEAFALLRALSAPRPAGEPGDSALVAVAVGHDRSTFAVSDGRVCEFTRVLDWGGSSLNVAIARALDLAPSEAEAIKRLVTLASADVPEGVAPDKYALAVDAVRRQVQTFARELVSSLQFYQNQPGSLGIGEIVITGGTANLVGLSDELQRLIGVRVRVGDPLARLKLTKKVAVAEQVGSLAVAIGLGIED